MASDSIKSENLLRRASRSDFDSVVALYSACRSYIKSLGLDQWQDGYPFDSDIERDVGEGSLWLHENPSIVGAIVINQGVDPQHDHALWQTKGDFRFIHRFALHPNYWGSGLAQRIMTAAEQEARRQGAACMRLDTYSLNERNLRFYEKLGYSRVEGLVYFEPHEAPFICFEKQL